MDVCLGFILMLCYVTIVTSYTPPRKRFEPKLSFKGPHILISDYEHQYDINGTLFTPKAKMFFWESAGSKLNIPYVASSLIFQHYLPNKVRTYGPTIFPSAKGFHMSGPVLS